MINVLKILTASNLMVSFSKLGERSSRIAHLLSPCIQYTNVETNLSDELNEWNVKTEGCHIPLSLSCQCWTTPSSWTLLFSLQSICMPNPWVRSITEKPHGFQVEASHRGVEIAPPQWQHGVMRRRLPWSRPATSPDLPSFSSCGDLLTTALVGIPSAAAGYPVTFFEYRASGPSLLCTTILFHVGPDFCGPQREVGPHSTVRPIESRNVGNVTDLHYIYKPLTSYIKIVYIQYLFT